MGDILSKEEIDALLQAVSTGEVPTESPAENRRPAQGTVKSYDFLRPITVSQRQRGALQMIHERFARSFGRSLSNFLGMTAEVKLMEVEPLVYCDFEPNLPNPCSLITCRFQGQKNRVLLALHPTVGFSIVDRVMGGAGVTMESMRAFTEIEQEIIDDAVQMTVDELSGAWERTMKCKAVAEEKFTSPQLMQFVSPEEMIVAVTMEIRVGETVGELDLCYPSSVLESINERTTNRALLVDEKSPEMASERVSLRTAVDRVPINVSVRMNSLPIKMRDLKALRAGDVLMLDRRIWDPVDLQVGGRVRYKGYLGNYKERMAFSVQQKI